MAKFRTHYDNLQVAENASVEVIKGAYRYLAQKWHPDKNPNDRELAERNTKIINEAYQVLSDPTSRRQHDDWIREQRTLRETVSPQPEDRNSVNAEQRTQQAAIWNPNAAVNWSILFTPLFGAWLHAKNWTALGELDRARKSMRWVYFSGMFILASPFLPDKAAAVIGFWLLLVWYSSSGRQQARYVKERLGPDYSRNGWAKPIGAALLVLFAFIGIVAVLSILFEPQNP
jgi:hypothetical protein